MKQPLVSVVMPSYNHREFVGKAIESVLGQTYENFEFIIADDGSTDGSPEVISGYDDTRIKFIRFEENTGFWACEYIYGQARGEYIATIASDDMWEETLLEKYVAFLEKNQEYGCCFCQPEIVDGNGIILENTMYHTMFTAENRTKEEWFKCLYLKGNCICAPSMCLRGSVYKELGPLRFQFRQLQDYEYWLRLVQISNIYIYPEKLIKYRVHEEGDNRNISSPTGESLVRGRIERKYILLDVMENLEEEFFLTAFAEDLMLQPEMEGFCVECEKFSVMLENSLVDPAIYYYFKHYNDNNFRNSLENYYHVARKEFWKLTGADHDQWYENVKNKHRVNMMTEKIVELRREIEQKDEEIKRIKNM